MKKRTISTSAPSPRWTWKPGRRSDHGLTDRLSDRLKAKASADEVLRRRLHNQRLTTTLFRQAGEVVSWLGAVQAQDYPGARWALGLRARGVDSAAIDAA